MLDRLVEQTANGTAEIGRLVARMFEELSNTDDLGRRVEYGEVCKALRAAEDNCRKVADWFRMSRLSLEGKSNRADNGECDSVGGGRRPSESASTTSDTRVE